MTEPVPPVSVTVFPETVAGPDVTAYETARPELAVAARANGESAGWCVPMLVGRFEYVEWTPENHLRHSRFVGLLEDRTARGVVQRD